MLRALLPITLLAAFAVGGCYGDADVGYRATYTTPSLAYVQPGVAVVADYDYPVFYSDGAYWRYDGGYWYQSPYYNRGWRHSYRVPTAVRSIRNPYAYRHYRAGGRVVVRDHRRW